VCREATQSGHGGKGMLPPAVWGARRWLGEKGRGLELESGRERLVG